MVGLQILGRVELGCNGVVCSVVEFQSEAFGALIGGQVTSSRFDRILRFHSRTAVTVVYASCPSKLALDWDEVRQ